MAIAFDTTSNPASTSSSPFTFSHTCSGTNRLLIVAVEGNVTTDTITGVTYAGVSMTKLDSVQMPANRWIYIYGLLAPATGANNVVITSTGTFIGACSASYTGVKQSGLPDAITHNTTTGTSLSTSLSSLSDNAWALALISGSGGATTVSTGQTVRVTDDDGVSIIDSNAVIHPAGSTTVTFTQALASRPMGCIMMYMAPVVTASAVKPFRALMGVGL